VTSAGIGRYLWLTALLSVCACATAPAPVVTPDRLARFFNELVYGNPAEPDGTSPTLVRWAEPRLLYAVSGERGPVDDRRIADAIERFGHLTGITLASGAPDAAEIGVEFTKGALIPVHDELARCFTRILFSPAGLRHAQIVVNTQTPGTLEACLDHELMHAFGFPHHSVVMASVMSPFRRTDSLTVADQAALAALYDPRLQIGMTHEAMAGKLDTILGERARIAASTSPPVFADPAGRAASDLEWHAVTTDTAALGFSTPVLEHAIAHHYWAAAPEATYVSEISLWSAPAAERPRLVARYVRLRERMMFARFLAPEDVAREWRAIADTQPRLGATGEHGASFGKVRYVNVETSEGPCLAFVANFYEGAEVSRHSRLDGYYCAPTGASIDADAIIDGLTLRAPRYAVPAR
jgi:Protein of unknown function (DUF2927)